MAAAAFVSGWPDVGCAATAQLLVTARVEARCTMSLDPRQPQPTVATRCPPGTAFQVIVDEPPRRGPTPSAAAAARTAPRVTERVGGYITIVY